MKCLSKARLVFFFTEQLNYDPETSDITYAYNNMFTNYESLRIHIMLNDDIVNELEHILHG